MAKVEILEEPTNNSFASVATDATSIAPPPDPVLSLELEDGGEAIFRIPTVKDLKLIEKRDLADKQKERAITDTCREIARVCLKSWDGSPEMPDDDDIYAADDQALVRLMLKQLAGDPGDDLSDEELMEIYVKGSDDKDYEVLPDKTHKVTLSLGSIAFRRMTRKDIKRIEANAGKTGVVTGDVMTAVSVCESWWGDRQGGIMPVDFDPIPLKEFRRVSAALNGFLQRSSNPNRRGLS